MSYTYLVCPDPSQVETKNLDNNFYVADNETHIDQYVQALAARGFKYICVYKHYKQVASKAKITTTYYKQNDAGELIPE